MQMPAMTEVQGQAAASRLQPTQQHNKKRKTPLFIFMTVRRHMATMRCCKTAEL